MRTRRNPSQKRPVPGGIPAEVLDNTARSTARARTDTPSAPTTPASNARPSPWHNVTSLTTKETAELAIRADIRSLPEGAEGKVVFYRLLKTIEHGKNEAYHNMPSALYSILYTMAMQQGFPKTVLEADDGRSLLRVLLKALNDTRTMCARNRANPSNNAASRFNPIFASANVYGSLCKWHEARGSLEPLSEGGRDTLKKWLEEDIAIFWMDPVSGSQQYRQQLRAAVDHLKHAVYEYPQT